MIIIPSEPAVYFEIKIRYLNDTFQTVVLVFKIPLEQVSYTFFDGAIFSAKRVIPAPNAKSNS